jgi:hypothetical protein
MYSHSASNQSNHKNASLPSNPLIALPQPGRRPSCRINTIISTLDAGTEGDTEKTPISKHRKSNLHSNTKPGRPSNQIHKIVRMPPTPDRSSIDSSNFLNKYENALARRSRKMLDPSYQLSKDESKKRKSNNDHSISAQKKIKRRKTDDPTYRNTQPVADSSDEEVPIVLVDGENLGEDVRAAKKRKRIADPTYRETAPSPDSLSEMDEMTRPRKKGKKNMQKARPTEVANSTKEHAAPSANSDHNMQANGKMQDAEDASVIEEAQNTEEVQEVGEMQVKQQSPALGHEVDTAETEDFLWERAWCTIM